MTEPALTAFDLEAIGRELWDSVGDAGARTMIISKRTFLMLRRARRMGERRKRARRLLHRGSLVKLREIDLPEITYQEPPREPSPGLRAFLSGGAQ